MTRDELLQKLTIAAGFLASATKAVVDDDGNYADVCLSFVHNDVLKVRAALKVQNDPATRTDLGLGIPGADVPVLDEDQT